MRLDLHDTIAPGLFRELDSRADQMRLFKTYVRNVTIELFDYCNRKCPYCPVSKVDRRSALNHMRSEHLARIAANLAEIDFDGSICLNLFNEPMADEAALLAGIRTLREHCPRARIWFNTNGDYLDKDNLARLAGLKLARLVITLHVPEGGTYDDLRQLTRVSQFSARTGVVLRFERFKPGRKLVASGRYDGITIKLQSVNFAADGENRAGTIDSIAVAAPRRAPCNRPFHDFTVAWNGNAYPCCQFFAGLSEHDPFIVGNVGSADSIFALYASGLMASFRRDLFGFGSKRPPCDSCTEFERCPEPGEEEHRAELARALFA